MSAYDVDCPYGGLGNWQEHDSVCLVCEHDTDCCYAKESAEIEAARDRRNWASAPRRTYSTPRSYRPAPARVSEPITRRTQKRPMPVEGEVPLVRLGKNILANVLSGIGEEVEYFHFKERQRRREEDPNLWAQMGLIGVEKAGGEMCQFFKEFNFPHTIPDCLPPHEEDE